MATVATFFNKFIYLFLVLAHLGCFFTFNSKNTSSYSKKRKISDPSSGDPKRKTHRVLCSRISWSFIKLVFTSKSQKNITTDTATLTVPTQKCLSAARALEQQSLDPHKLPTGSCQESDLSSDNTNNFFPLLNDIFPCTACGEIFQTPLLLRQHQSVEHAISELIDGDTGNNIVRIIFKTGWTDTQKNNPSILRILKIHNSPNILFKFEEYREAVKAKAREAVKRREERCIADGNELLRFHCSTFLCDLGLNGQSSICSQKYCNICGIIKSGFSAKLDGISTLSSSWRAHLCVPEEIEQEFKFMNVKRAMLVCRVIAGRIGCFDTDQVNKEDGGYDSSIAARGVNSRLDEEDLLVFNPRAVLPCFVIVYTTQ